MNSILRSKILPSPIPYNSYFSRKSTPGIVRFQKSAVAGGTNRPESDGDGERMDKAAGKKEKGIRRGDAMSSFGEGYATRSEEEGFGGIYGGNHDEHENEKEKDTQDEHSHEFDKQGSEVKEKETSRHQKDANA